MACDREIEPTAHSSPRPACRIFVASAPHLRDEMALSATARRTAGVWKHASHAVSYWIHQSLACHPWRTHEAEQADLVYVDSLYDYRCSVQHLDGWPGRVQWLAALNATRPMRSLAAYISSFLSPCWLREFSREFVSLHEHAGREEVLVAPFVVSKPAWLVNERQPVPWALAASGHVERLVLFVGSMTKLYLNPTRYLIWRQLVDDPRATVWSPNVACRFGSLAGVCVPRGTRRANSSLLEAQCRRECGEETREGAPSSLTALCEPSARHARLERMCKPAFQLGINVSDPEVLLPREVSHSCMRRAAVACAEPQLHAQSHSCTRMLASG